MILTDLWDDVIFGKTTRLDEDSFTCSLDIFIAKWDQKGIVRDKKKLANILAHVKEAGVVTFTLVLYDDSSWIKESKVLKEAFQKGKEKISRYILKHIDSI